MEEKITSLKKTARLAGLLYLILAITAVYGVIYVSSQVIVRGDAAATANNILAHEFLFRTGIVSHLISQVLFVFLVLVLYRLLRQVNEHQAKLMVALVMVSVPISFFIEILNITSLMILKGEVLKALEPKQLQDLALIFRKTRVYGFLTVGIYFGLWLIPFGQLVYKSGFIPRIFGVLLIINGIVYVFDSLTFLLFPNYHSAVSQITTFLFPIGEIPIILWFLIKGVKVQKRLMKAKSDLSPISCFPLRRPHAVSLWVAFTCIRSYLSLHSASKVQLCFVTISKDNYHI